MILGAGLKDLDVPLRNFYLLLACLVVLVLILYKVTGMGQLVQQWAKRNNFGEQIKAISFDKDRTARVIVNAKGVIVGWNEAAFRLFKFAEEEMLGKPFAILLPESLQEPYTDSFVEYPGTLDLGVLKEPVDIPTVRKGGKTVFVRMVVSICRVRDDYGFMCALEDVTQRVHETGKLHDLIKMMEYAESLAGYGSFLWNVLTDDVVYSTNFDKIWQWTGLQRGSDAYLSQIHPGDRQQVLRALAHMKDTKLGYEQEYRAYGRDGIVLSFKTHSFCGKDSHGNLTFVVGLIRRLHTT